MQIFISSFVPNIKILSWFFFVVILICLCQSWSRWRLSERSSKFFCNTDFCFYRGRGLITSKTETKLFFLICILFYCFSLILDTKRLLKTCYGRLRRTTRTVATTSLRWPVAVRVARRQCFLGSIDSCCPSVLDCSGTDYPNATWSIRQQRSCSCRLCLSTLRRPSWFV